MIDFPAIDQFESADECTCVECERQRQSQSAEPAVSECVDPDPTVEEGLELLPLSVFHVFQIRFSRSKLYLSCYTESFQSSTSLEQQRIFWTVRFARQSILLDARTFIVHLHLTSIQILLD